MNEQERRIRKKEFELEVLLPHTNAMRINSPIINNCFHNYLNSNVPFTDFTDELIFHLQTRCQHLEDIAIDLKQTQPMIISKTNTSNG